MRALRTIGIVLAVIGISFAATVILIWIRPEHAVSLLVYLPGIVIVEAVFGLEAGLGAVLLSVAGSAAYGIWFLPPPVPHPHQTVVREIILLIVGAFVVVLMELHRRSRYRVARGAQQLAAVLGNISDAVVIFGPDFRVLSMNAAAQAMFEIRSETTVGRSATDLTERFPFTPDGPPSGPQPLNLEAASRAGITVHEQGTIYDVRRKRRVQVLIHAIPWRGLGGVLEGSVVVISDLTAVKDLQTRLLDMARQAAVGRMFSGLSHDFNHALDIVRRALAVLDMNENASPEERRKYRVMIDRAAVEGSQIVRRLRDYLAGGGDPTPVNLATLAQQAIELTRPLWRNREGLEIVTSFDPVPAIIGQHNDLQRVLVNLLFNAIESIGASPGRIIVHTEADFAHVRASVEDSGPGIAPDQLPRLFDAYFTTKPQGLGLGLFSASQIAQAHGGTLRATSEPGRATRFTLELPREEAQQAA